ncbi:MAG: hypothetical protein AAFO91_19915, partial [Bacteroidota bacterium]
MQRYVLALMYFSTEGEGWHRTHNFLNTSSGECNWMETGITCNEFGVITELDFCKSYPQSMEKGAIPFLSVCASFCFLSILSCLWESGFTNLLIDLSSNMSLSFFILPFSGSVHKPANNNMRGQLPHEVLSLTNLVRLNLRDNTLQGTVPSEGLEKLTLLKELNLAVNKLKGTIPSATTLLPQIEILEYAENSMGGTLPEDISRLTKLSTLTISSNAFTGSIPLSFFFMKQVTYFNFIRNQLTGTIPTEVGQMSMLTRLALVGNKLNSTIPSELGKLRQIINMQVSWEWLNDRFDIGFIVVGEARNGCGNHGYHIEKDV